MLDVDLLVIGGGLVGSSLATAIISHPLSKSLNVAIVDPKIPSTDEWPSTSLRTSTITPSSKLFLEDIGVWGHLPTARIAPFEKMFIWDHPKPLPLQTPSPDLSKTPAGTIVFDAADVAEANLGFVVDNDTLRNAMYRRMSDLVGSDQSNLRIIQGAVKSIDYGEDSGEDDTRVGDDEQRLTGGEESVPWPVVELDSGERIRCRLIAACDGARSRVRTICAADWFSCRYDQSAVVANVQLLDASSTAFQRFVSTGPVAVLPVASEDTAVPMGNIIWTTTPVEAQALAESTEHVFIDELNKVLNTHEDGDDVSLAGMLHDDGPVNVTGDVALWNFVAKGLQVALPKFGVSSDAQVETFVPPPQCTKVIGSRGYFPLVLGHAPRYVIHERRTVLVGDAAHSVHPLAGQGVNLGFADADSLGACIAKAAGTGRDVGGEMGAPLMQFQRERMVANLGMIGLLHGLQRTFHVENTKLRGLRRAGISALNAVSPIKKLILRAMR